MHDATRLIHEQLKESVWHLWAPNVVFGHGFDHAERVYEQVINMATDEDIEPLVVGAAAFLMDVGLNTVSGRSGHVKRSIEIASNLINLIPELSTNRNLVIECIRYHEAESDVPDTVSKETMILHDSDTLDRMGFTGIGMTIEYGIWIERRFNSMTDPFCQKRKPDLNNYTLDYIVYTNSLSTMLLLMSSQMKAQNKMNETKAYLHEIQKKIRHGIEIEHSQARAILSQLQEEPYNE